MNVNVFSCFLSAFFQGFSNLLGMSILDVPTQRPDIQISLYYLYFSTRIFVSGHEKRHGIRFYSCGSLWGCSVADKLSRSGEGLLSFRISRTLSMSACGRTSAMQYAQSRQLRRRCRHGCEGAM